MEENSINEGREGDLQRDITRRNMMMLRKEKKTSDNKILQAAQSLPRDMASLRTFNLGTQNNRKYAIGNNLTVSGSCTG